MFIMGVLASAILMIVMVVTRLMVVTADADEFILEEIETVQMVPPPEPEMLEENEPEEVSEVVPPPAVDVSVVPTMEVPVIVASDAVVEPDVEFEMFAEDVEVAALPVVKKIVKVERPTPKVTSRPSRPSSPRQVAKPAPPKSHYSVGELDGVPRNLRLGSFVWPRGVSSNVVRARVDVEIDERGRVHVLNVSSLSDARMRSVILRLVRGSRFSAPKKNGRAVKARYSWPLTLKKPR